MSPFVQQERAAALDLVGGDRQAGAYVLPAAVAAHGLVGRPGDPLQRVTLRRDRGIELHPRLLAPRQLERPVLEAVLVDERDDAQRGPCDAQQQGNDGDSLMSLPP
jgi:hypothetical protein